MSAAMQDCRDTPLSIPALPDDVDALTAALAYAAAGWYLVPVRRGTKHPGSVLGEHWPALSSRDREVIVSWFAGTDHGIALHVGRSGAVVFDIDTPEKAPITLRSAERECNPPTQRTRSDQRRHLVFAVPPGRTLSNQRGKLGIGWGEVRGTNGVIIVAPSVHPSGGHYRWVVTGVVPMLPHGVADMLPDAGPGEAAADSATIAEFARRYGAGDGTKSINGPLRTFADRLDEGDSRHEALVAVACWACREARAGAYPAAEARARLREAFVLSMAHAKGEARLLPPQAARYEFDGMWAWAVGQALADGGEEPVVEAGPVSELPANEEPAEAGGEEEEWTPEELAIRRHKRLVGEELEKLEIREEALRRLRVKNLPELSVLDAKQFLAATMPEWLVRDFLYRASTAKVYGPPGGTKSFFLLDVALHLATGHRWHGRDLPRTPVHYVMAEGQAVNTLRTHGWLVHHSVEEGELEGWFTAIPQGILLTPEGIERYLAVVEAHQPGLVILDTKNRMMVGEENSASDVAVMIRAMDAIRETSGACVCLVDHTGILDQTRGRGSNAVTAAMDSEIKVGVTDCVATAEVTRDKAGVIGERISYMLVTVDDVPTPPGIRKPAVCDPVAPAEIAFDPIAEEARKTWGDPDPPWLLPKDVLELKGPGQAAVPDVARYMRWCATSLRGAGRTRAEMLKDVRKLGTYKDDTVLRNAWDRLLEAGRIKNVTEGSNSKAAASHWIALDSDPRQPKEG